MNFGALKTRVTSLLGRAPADVCYELVTADINQEMRLRVMEATATLTEAASVALPADFLEVVSIYRDTDPRTSLRPASPQAFQRMHQASGIPSVFSVVDGALLLSPTPNGAEDLQLRYYARLSDLVAGSDTNDVLDRYPALYVYGVLAHHAALIRDEKALAIHFAAYEKAKQQARADDARTRYGGAPVVPIARTAP